MNTTNYSKAITVADCLDYLEVAGWSELIDTRWRRQVEKELRQEFGVSLSEETLKEAVNVVLFPDKELPEEEYEFLDHQEEFFKDFLEKRKIECGWYERHPGKESQSE